MSDIARLNLAVDSSETVIAIESLEQLAQVSADAEKAAEKLGGATKQQAKQLKELDKAAKTNEATERRSIDQVLERARAYTKTAGAEVAALQAAERNRDSTRKLAEEKEKLRNGLSKLLATIDPLEAKLNKLDDAEVKLHKTFRAGVIDAEKYAETLAKIGAKRNDIVEKQLKEIGEGAGFASEMIKLLGLNSRESQRDLLNLGRAAASGNWSQMQSSMFQITRSSGALSVALSGVGLSIGAVAAGVGALGYMYYQGYRESQEFNRSLALTGNAAGTTTERLTAMSRSIGENITYTANTAKAVQEVARTGKIAADSIEEVALASIQMQQAFGQAVDQTISEFVRLGEAPSTALLELNSKYQHLTFSVYEQVRALEDQGREEEAAALAQRHHSEQLGIRADEVIKHIGAIERAYLKTKKSVQDTWQAISDGIAGVGRQKTLLEQYEESEAILRDLAGERQKLLSVLNTPFEPQREGGADLGLTNREMARRVSLSRDQATAQQQLKEVEAAIEVQQREHEYIALQKANEEQAAKVIADQRKNDQNRIKALQAQDDYAKQYTKLTRNEELAKAVKEFEDLTKGLDKTSVEFQKIARAHQNRIDEINKRHDKSSRCSSGTDSFAAEIARVKARIEEETNLAAAAEKTIAQVSRLNEFERRALQLRELAKSETKAVNKAKMEELATLNEQAGALVRTNKLTEEAAKERLRYLEGIEKSTDKTRDEAQRIRDQARTMGMSKTALEELTNARIKEQIAQLQGKEGSEEEIRLLKEQLMVREDLAKAIGERDLARIAHEAQQASIREWEQTVDQYGDVFRQGFADMLNNGKDGWKSFTTSLVTTFKTSVADQIYKMFAQPFVARVAVGVSGLLGGGAAVAAQGAGGGFNVLGGLSGVNSLANAFSGGVVNSLSSAIGGLGNAFGSSALTSFASGMAGTLASTSAAGISAIGSTAAASLGTTVGTGALGATAYSSGMSAATLGAKFAAVAPWLAGAGAVVSIGSMLHNAFKGETRVGGGFARDVATGQTYFGGGPSGGYGGQAQMAVMDATLSGFADSVTGLFDALSLQSVQLANTVGSFESSSKGRGGTSSGGALVVDGQVVYFGSVNDTGGVVKGKGYGGRSGSAEEMFEAMTKDMAYSTLEAWQAVSDRMPSMISDMLSSIDVRSLGVEQAQALAAEITTTVSGVNALSEAFSQMPMANLRDLTFDATGALIQFSGGLDAITSGFGTYFQNFYTESERQAQSVRQMSTQLSDLNQGFPATRQGYRDLADGLDLSTEAGQKLYAALMSMSGAAASFYDYVEQQSEASFNTISASITASRDEYIGTLQSNLQAELQGIRDTHAARVQSIRDEHAQRAKLTRESISSVNEKLRELSGISSSLASGLATLRSQSELAVQLYRDASLQTIDSAISAARSGQSLTAVGQLQDAISSVSKLDASGFTSLFDFELERAETVNRLKELEGLTGGQIDVQEMQLTSLNKQLESLDVWRDTQIQRLDAWRDTSIEHAQTRHDEAVLQAQEHFDALLLDERERFDAQIAEMLNEQANQLLINESIDAGTLSTAHGLSAVQSAVTASAARIASAVSSIRVDVSLGGQRMPAFADGGYYRGGLALVGEKGPEIINFSKPGMVYTAAQSKNLMAGGDNKELIGLLRQLIAMAQDQSAELRSVALSISQVLGVLRDVTQGGTELRTKEVIV